MKSDGTVDRQTGIAEVTHPETGFYRVKPTAVPRPQVTRSIPVATLLRGIDTTVRATVLLSAKPTAQCGNAADTTTTVVTQADGSVINSEFMLAIH
ncbi:hypothetical protein [Streptomyces sp. NPDC004284]|uniref:hypothetical protein n=1 Tax=Streptomyces sp. NPDC004284 TaxID=3364695 RepID=UPI0036C6E2C1